MSKGTNPTFCSSHQAHDRWRRNNPLGLARWHIFNPNMVDPLLTQTKFANTCRCATPRANPNFPSLKQITESHPPTRGLQARPELLNIQRLKFISCSLVPLYRPVPLIPINRASLLQHKRTLHASLHASSLFPLFEPRHGSATSGVLSARCGMLRHRHYKRRRGGRIGRKQDMVSRHRKSRKAIGEKLA